MSSQTSSPARALTETQPDRSHRLQLSAPPAWVCGLLLAIPLALAYLILAPPAADLAAATYRSDVFSSVGFTLWDNGWYGGHHLLGYSLLSPALGALLGVRLLLALSAVAASALLGAVAARVFSPAAARVAAAWFAFGLCLELLSGRVPYDLGMAIGIGAVLAILRGRTPLALSLAVLTSVASPVAGAFLALAGVAGALAGVAGALAAWHGGRGIDGSEAGGARAGAEVGRGAAPRGLALAGAALAPILLLTLAFPEGGYEPFAPSAFWPVLAGMLLAALLLPREHLSARQWQTLRIGIGLYAFALAGSYAVRTPVGGNAARLGPLLAGPLLAGVLWDRRRGVLFLLVPGLIAWQLSTPLGDLSAIAGDPAVNASYYTPLRTELHALTGGAPTRIEIPLTGSHWETAYLPDREGISLARGWERQLDTRNASLFYGETLTPAAYHAWLQENAVAYVALPDARADYSSDAEDDLLARDPPYLREIWHSAHWRLYAVLGATPLVQAPARLLGLGADSFALAAPAPGSYTVRVRFTPYWALSAGTGCVDRAPGGWTSVQAQRAGTIAVAIDFSIARIFAHGARCRGG